MTLPDTTIKALKLLAATSDEVKQIMGFYDFITSSDVYESYVTRKLYLTNWNKELNDKKVDLINTKEDAAVHDKAVDRVRNFFNDQKDFITDTMAIYQMLSPEQQEAVKEDKRLQKSKDLAL